MQLTEEQENIVKNCASNIYVSAAPGSGKSTVLGLVADKILESNPNNIVLLVTFTNKAAKSIVGKCSSNNASRIIGGTFHSIAYRQAKEAGLNWNICDESKKRLLIKKTFDCRKKKQEFDRIYESISLMKSEWPWPTDNSLLNRYNTELERFNLCDFDDIIKKYIDEIQCNSIKIPNVTHILVDELQDTSMPQLVMLRRLQEKTGCNMIGVGDLDQCLYSWRGARPENVQDFINTFDCKVLNMGTNFRSGVKIVTSSEKLIINNKKRIQKTIRPREGAPRGSIIKTQCENHFDEIDLIVRRIIQNPDKEIAILYRNRTYKNHLEFKLRQFNVSYCVNDMLDITDRSAIKVILACSKLACRLGDIYDLEIAAKALKGIGTTSVKNLGKKLREDCKSLQDIVNDAKSKTKQPKYLQSIIQLQDYFKEQEGCTFDIFVHWVDELFIDSFEFQEDIKNFLIDIGKCYKFKEDQVRELCNELGLDGKEKDDGDENAQVQLSTVHGYKGLERDIVIVPWAQQYLEVKPNKEIDLEAERRLFYVAVTRAKEKLYLLYSGKIPLFIQEMKL